jgi:hypothetical protein
MHILPAEPVVGKNAGQLKEILFNRMSDYYSSHH